jgi:RNA polymerase II subunit A small phosphatase-like protein
LVPLGHTAGTEASADPSTPRKKKRGPVTKFLAKLGCCGATEDADATDLENPAVPARKTSKIQSGQARQTTPVKKPDTSAAESSTTGSKEMIEDKIAGTPYDKIRSAGEPRMQEQQSANVTKTSHDGNNSSGQANELQDGTQIVSQGAGQQSAVIISNASTSSDQREAPQQSALPTQIASVVIEPPTPTMPIQDPDVQQQSPQQDDHNTDVPMPDAPPLETNSVDQTKTIARSEPAVEPTLPPPPPRPNPVSSGHDRPEPNTAAVRNEQQKWLLPPIKPEFRGKKCLVLDLDETLVHSSFKVCL